MIGVIHTLGTDKEVNHSYEILSVLEYTQMHINQFKNVKVFFTPAGDGFLFRVPEWEGFLGTDFGYILK